MTAGARTRTPQGVSGNETWVGPFTEPPATLDPATLRAAPMLDLTMLPASPAGVALVDALAALISGTEQRGNKRGARGQAKLRDGVGAIVGSILHHWSGETPRPVFHPRQAQAFTGAAVGHRQFTAAVDGLAALHLVRRAESKQFAADFGFDFGPVSTGYAARYWPDARLLAMAGEHGITRASARADFAMNPAASSIIPPVVGEPLLLRSLKPPRRRDQGKPVSIPLRISPDDTEAAALSAGVRTANEFASQFAVRGCLPPRWYRIFVAGWSLGGRWVAAGALIYQNMSKVNRLGVTIDGEAVAEVDVRASHLTILHGLFRLPLWPGDPYAFAGIERENAKLWTVKTLGKGSPLMTWSVDDRTRAEGASARDVGTAVIARFPFLAEPWRAVVTLAPMGHPRAILTHRLMAIEAAALTSAMRELREAGILALPVHDALLVPVSAVAPARDALTKSYQDHAGITPVVTVNGAIEPA
jgi:hypothetical protein